MNNIRIYKLSKLKSKVIFQKGVVLFAVFCIVLYLIINNYKGNVHILLVMLRMMELAVIFSVFGFILAFVIYFIAKYHHDFKFNISKRVSVELTNIANELTNDRAGKYIKVYTYYSSDIDAFTVASFSHDPEIFISSALIGYLSKNELIAVLGHEVGHIKNKDTFLKLFVSNTFLCARCFVTIPIYLIYFFFKICAYLKISDHIFRFPNELANQIAFGRRGININTGSNNVLEKVFVFILKNFSNIISLILLNFFGIYISSVSREMEYRADAFSAIVTKKEYLISSLIKINNLNISNMRSEYNEMSFSFYKSSIFGLLNSHPSLEERISAIENETYINLCIEE